MEEVEIQIFEEINDYKEKFGALTFRQWVFAALIVATVVPVYLLLPKVVGDDIAQFIVIAIAGVLGFIGFVKIHDLPAEKIIPYWLRHYFAFNKKIIYMTEQEYADSKDKKKQKAIKQEQANIQKAEVKEKKAKVQEKNTKNAKQDQKEEQQQKKADAKLEKKLLKQQKELEKAKKKYGHLIKEETVEENEEEKPKPIEEVAAKRFNDLTEEQKKAILDLIGK